MLGNILTAAQPNGTCPSHSFIFPFLFPWRPEFFSFFFDWSPEHCLGNITRRVLFFIREAHHQEKQAQNSAFTLTLQDLLVSSDGVKRSEGQVEFKSTRTCGGRE